MWEWTTVGDETEQVDVSTPLARPLEGGPEHFVLEQGAAFDVVVQALQALLENAARSDRQVTDLGVAHLAVGQADGGTRALDRRVRIGGEQPVVLRRRSNDNGQSFIEELPVLTFVKQRRAHSFHFPSSYSASLRMLRR